MASERIFSIAGDIVRTNITVTAVYCSPGDICGIGSTTDARTNSAVTEVYCSPGDICGV